MTNPTFSKILVFAFQQLLAIMAATIAVPAIVGNGMSASAALFGAGVGTLVYVVIALVVKFVGVGWINKLMPAAVIGPTVAIIGLSLAGAAVKDVFSYGPTNDNGAFIMTGNIWISFICAIVTLVVVILCSTYGKK